MKWLKRKARKFLNWVKDPGLDILIAGNFGSAIATAIVGGGLALVSGSWVFAGVAISAAALEILLKSSTIIQLIAAMRAYA